MKRLLRIVGTLMIVAGVCLLAWAVTVWQWQDPFTALLHSRDQKALTRSFERELQRHPQVQIATSAEPSSPCGVGSRRASGFRG